MLEEKIISPAEEAANKAIQETIEALSTRSNFRVEAGAGAGKTYSLIKALKYLIQEKEFTLQKGHQQIACITYTEVARDQIRKRIDNNPVIFVETIHAFSWNLIQNFQDEMRQIIPELNVKWKERLEAIPLRNQIIKYSLGYPKITDDEIYLHHDDVISIIAKLLYKIKFQQIVESKFPIILVDEYQDTNKDLAKALVENFVQTKVGPLIGLFGDHWQKIYDRRTCGLISADQDKLRVIGKNANFRSDRVIVDALNKIRPSLPQNVSDPSSTGEILVFHTNEWSGKRRTDNHWQGDLPADSARNCFKRLLEILNERGWETNLTNSKILMLTNNLLATEQGYSNLADVFDYSDDYLKKGDAYIEYFADILEPACRLFSNGNYGEMFKLLNLRSLGINSHEDKISWNRDMKRIIEARRNKSIRDILDIVKETKRPRLSSRVEEKESHWEELKGKSKDPLPEEDSKFLIKIEKLKSVPYQEVIRMVDYIEDRTPFSTKHGVKGEQFENVIVILGRGWNNYNWNQMLEWFNSGAPADKQESFERNRNLFYVCCSRPKHRLCLLFTQKLSETAMNVLKEWFGDGAIQAIKGF